METFNNVTQAASRAIWGENTNTQEPLSGQRGDTAKGEPYDAGNIEVAHHPKTEGLSAQPSSGLSAESSSRAEGLPTESSSRSEGLSTSKTESIPHTSTEAVSSSHTESIPKNTENLSSSNTEGAPRNTEAVSSSHTESASKNTEGLSSSQTESVPKNTEGLSSTPGQTNSSENQAAPSEKLGETETKSKDEPSVGKAPIPANVGDKEDPSQDKTEKVVSDDGTPELKGPGPKPLSVVAKEHGGDAGNVGKTELSGQEKSDDPKDDKAESGSSESKGTGEEWVKTTGLQADGGDFDATKPGAGKEADRIMLEKGMRKDDPNAPKTAGGSEPEAHEKPSLGERIKDKFHKH